METGNKTKSVLFSVLLIIICIGGLQFMLTSGKKDVNSNNDEDIETEVYENVEKVQVVHFHATQQCWSCITVGELAEKTIKENFPEEYISGKIEFLDVNADLNENAEIVKRFGAAGSSLFINVIRNGKDEISEDVQVWRLVSDEEKYISYFENKLSGYLK